jgi:hypothetical protein
LFFLLFPGVPTLDTWASFCKHSSIMHPAWCFVH